MWRVLGIISWVFLVTILAVSLYIFGYILISSTPMGPQNTGIFPQVVSCVPEHPPQRHTGPNWQPTLRVQVEPCATLDESGSTTHSGAPSTTTSDTSDE